MAGESRKTKGYRLVSALLRELADEAGVALELGYGSRHCFYEITKNGVVRRKPFGLNAGRSSEGQLKAIRREFANLIKEMDLAA